MSEIAYCEPEHLIRDFASRGLVVLAPEALGLSHSTHDRILTQEKQVVANGEPVTCARIPEILDVINAPGLVAAFNQLLGRNWAVVPFTHNAPFTSGGRDQHWHKDDNGHYNGRKQRHHQAVQIEFLYYPQAVSEQMGPTATVPYSHYWTTNHEENHDNFAGADHLDFNYQIDGLEREPVSGPDSRYDTQDIATAQTAHDIRMRDAVTDTGWPLVKSMEAAPLRPGSVVIYSHNTYHRGNHRRDPFETWVDNPRFMWRFWLYRTTEADGLEHSPGDAIARAGTPQDRWTGIDPLTGADLSTASADVRTVWRYHDHWMRTGQPPAQRPAAASLSVPDRMAEADCLFEQLHTKGEAAEPARIGAAYQLASIGDPALATRLLARALFTDRESVRRAATYGLIAVGPEATDALLEAARSPIKWVRKAGVYGLGDASPLNADTLTAVTTRLREDESVYVRSVAAGTLGCLGRRAAGSGEGADLIPACLEALIDCLGREENRPPMDRAQGRSIKFVRPTDESDVCEGGGVDFGLDRFELVRSAVRENAMWSMVILCSHGAAVAGRALGSVIETLQQIVREDVNVACVGYAQDALTRLAHLTSSSGSSATGDHRTGGESTDPQEVSSGLPDDVAALILQLQESLLDTLRQSPMQGWEALVRAGLPAAIVAEFQPQDQQAR